MRPYHFVLALCAGMAAAGGFAPWNLFPAPVVALALLFYLLMQTHTPRRAAWLGFAFGLGLFGTGVSWIYIALHDYGYMPMPLAFLATALFVALLALFPALAAYAYGRIAVPRWAQTALLLPALWVAAELLRGYLFTGFPWLALGYSQTASPLAGYAAILGVYGVSFLVALSGGALTMLAHQPKARPGQIVASIIVMLWLGGAFLQHVAWTQPLGAPIKVSLLQGNIAQDEKFDESQLVSTLEDYRREIFDSDARLIVLPETAFPLLRNEVPENYTRLLAEHARKLDGDILIGAFEREQDHYYNSMYSVGASPSQHYRKSHLVPFGEFIPLRPLLGWLINDVLNIPMSDLASGGFHQPLLELAGQHIAMNICYEDVFGEEIIRALPQATLLLNASNDAWYGNSAAALQHNQISQMRALESGRMMLRATNTGVTSVIGSDGRILHMLPQHQPGTLTAEVQGYTGSTPYVRWGNWAIALLLLGTAALLWKIRAPGARHA